MQPTRVTQPADAVDDAEQAFGELCAIARKKTAKIPVELLARHVLETYPGAGWPVQRAAIEALVRRCGFAERDQLIVASKPAGGLGHYVTRPRRSAKRPYNTVLWSVAPLAGSCDCADFRRASLGACKHLLVALANLCAKPRLFERAQSPAGGAQRPPLSWSPIRPLFGSDDWMERIELVRDGASAGASIRKIARLFTPLATGGAGLKSTHAEDTRRRLELVEELSACLRGLARSRTGLDPALRARLEDERTRLERRRAMAGATTPARTKRALGSLKRPLYDYQREGVVRFLAEGRLLLADDMGLGKTAQAIGIGHVLWRMGLIERGLLIVPASLKPQWASEWNTFTDTPLEIVDGSAAERAAIYRRQKRGFLVANYEQVLRDLDSMQGWRPDLIVLDEAQRIKNWAAKTSHGVKALQSEYRLVLTGTPLENRIDELASIFDWVEDHALEPKWRLVPFHAVPADESQSARVIEGAQHLDTLRERIAPCTLRRRRAEILTQLPARTDTRIPVPLTAEQSEEHDALSVPIITLLSIRKRRPLTQAEFMRLMQLLNTQRIIANGLAQADFQAVWGSIEGRRPTERRLRGLFSPKLGELRELVRQLVLDQGRKVIVFSQWRRMLRLADWAVADLLGDAGLRAVFFTGAEGAKRRTHNLVDLHDDPDTRVLFTTDAGGVGLNLQRAANACILLELPWNPAVLEQRVARIHRAGQTDPIDVYYLIGAGSIEERLSQLVSAKQALFRGIFDTGADEVQFDGSGTFLEGVSEIFSDAADGFRSGDREADDSGEGELESTATEQLEECVERADEATDSEPALQTPTPGQIDGLFAGLEVRRTEQGGLAIEVPPESAAALSAVLRGIATLFE